MNVVEWLVFAAACKIVHMLHPESCQCNVCHAASVVAAFGLHMQGLLLPTVELRRARYVS